MSMLAREEGIDDGDDSMDLDEAIESEDEPIEGNDED
jgi:hypothetical protein